MKWSTGIVSLMIAALCWVGVARADTEPRVNDQAHFFKPETVQEVDTQLKQLKSDTGVEIVVETFPGIPQSKQAAYDAAKNDATAKNDFYADWIRERGKEIKLFGVYVLIVKNPGHVHVLAGKATGEKAFPKADENQLQETLTSAFKEKNYDEGLLKAIPQAAQAIKDNLGGEKLRSTSAGGHDPFVARTGAMPSPAPVAVPVMRQTHFSCFWIFLVIVGVLIVINILRRTLGGGGGPSNYGNAGGYAPPGSPGYGYGPGAPPRSGGFMSGLFGGLLGGAAGSYIENRFENRNPNIGGNPMDTGSSGNYSSGSSDSGSGGDFGSSSSGSDFGSSGGDSGSGGDFGGGGDSGGGSGGDF